MDKNKQAQYMIRRIGGTTYKVRVAFSESGKETMEDKILRMIRNEVVNLNSTFSRAPSAPTELVI